VTGPPTPGAGQVPLSRASAVRPRGDGVFDADASTEWTIAGRPNGGYLLALMGRAASTTTAPAHVVACSAHFLRSPEAGPVEIRTELLRCGRSVSQVRVGLRQGGRSCVEALMTTGVLHEDEVPRFDGGVPVLPPVPFEDGTRLEPVTPDGLRVPMLDQVDLRLDPDCRGLTRGRATGRGRISGWIELLGEKGFDPVSLLYAVDAFPPASMDTAAPSWAPTVELTAYVRAVPAPGPVRVLTRARLVSPEWVDETCDVWDVNGRLVAQATQLAKVPTG
jgi:acyl-coenzyme A thioesterase PaaI-like protein